MPVGSGRTAVRRAPRAAASLGAAILGVFLTASPAFAHVGEQNVPAITDVQEAIAILATQPDLIDHAMDKVHDATDSTDTGGVRIDLVKQAEAALEGGRMDQALVLLERSIGACPGAPVIEPQNAPRTPPPLTSPCPSPAADLEALATSPVGGVQEPVLIVMAAVLILIGFGLARRIH